VRYSFNNAITAPRQVLKGGYLSWHEPISDHWFQQSFFGAKPVTRDLGQLDRKNRSLREMIDELTPQTKRLSRLPKKTKQLTGAIEKAESSATAYAARAETLRSAIRTASRRAPR
jgi:hypothetical protein